MSALQAPVTGGDVAEPVRRGSSRLRAVDPPARRLSRAPFLLVLIGVFGLGMAGLLMLNTTLQNQAFASRALDRQATEYAYAQADLESRLDVLTAPPELARQASALGMRPNPYPALLRMPDGKVLGRATRVRGDEVPSMVVKTPAEIAADKAAAQVRAAARAAAEKAAAKKAAAKEAAAKKAAEAAAKKKAAEKKVADAAAAKKAAAEKKTTEKKATASTSTAEKPTEKTPAEKKSGRG